jgi:hypothetical protein
VRVWLDEWELRVGDSLVERLEAGILQAGYLAVVLSSRSVESAWVQRELNAALAEELRRQGVFILPVLLENCEIPLFVRDKMYADFRTRYADGLQSILRTVLPGEGTPPKLIFDRGQHDASWSTWALHCSDGPSNARIGRLIGQNGLTQVVLAASAGQSIGLNKSVPTLHGRVSFEYRIASVGTPGGHVYFAMIPIQETGYNRFGVIEVGTVKAGDPRNPKSPHRLRHYVPISHQLEAGLLMNQISP